MRRITGAALALIMLGACSSDSESASTAATSAATVETDAETTDATTPETDPPETDAPSTEATEPPSTTDAPETTEEPATTEAPTTTTEPDCPEGQKYSTARGECIIPESMMTTTTVPRVPRFDDGTYIVGAEIPAGVYRVGGYYARLDAGQEIIDNDIVDNCPTIMIVQPTDSYVEISGAAIGLDLSAPFDPIAQGCTDGTFVVGLDLQPGQYRVNPTGGTSYWARLDGDLEILDNNISEGQTIVVVKPGDFALSITGTLELIP